ncbi:MAG: DUF411 domain-containing protein [Methylocystis sp.]|nr:DUF411 domain-containing protein [Methylocystis sp.]
MPVPVNSLTRRKLLGVLAGVTAAAGMTTSALAGALPRVTVHRSPTCRCCKAWAAHLREAGFNVDIIDEAEMASVKTRLRVPPSLASCHTAEVGGYVVEGHVPAVSIRRLLDERPNAIGLAVAGMPAGSPGMEGAGAPDAYDVVLFDATGQRSYAKFLGGAPI